MDRALRIAHCAESYAPAIGGMAEVVRQLSERMAADGHEVTVLTGAHADRSDGLINGVRLKGFRVMGNAVDGITGEADAYLQELREGGYDLITFFAAQQWATDAALLHLDELPAKKVLVPTGFSALRDPRWADYYARMPDRMKRMGVCVFHSEGYQDAVFAREHGVTASVLIPNGAAEEEFEAPLIHDFRAAHDIEPDQSLVTHIGGYTGIKGQREAIEIFIAARTGNAVLALIGHGVMRLKQEFDGHWRMAPLRLRALMKHKRILFLEIDRASTVAALRQSDLFLFPSRVECSPIVLFEAMAAGVPFLASEAGNSAEIARWSQGGQIMPCSRDRGGQVIPDMHSAVRMLKELLPDAQRRERMGEAGHAAWKERFTWRRIAQRYLEEYQKLMGTL